MGRSTCVRWLTIDLAKSDSRGCGCAHRTPRRAYTGRVREYYGQAELLTEVRRTSVCRCLHQGYWVRSLDELQPQSLAGRQKVGLPCWISSWRFVQREDGTRVVCGDSPAHAQGRRHQQPPRCSFQAVHEWARAWLRVFQTESVQSVIEKGLWRLGD